MIIIVMTTRLLIEMINMLLTVIISLLTLQWVGY